MQDMISLSNRNRAGNPVRRQSTPRAEVSWIDEAKESIRVWQQPTRPRRLARPRTPPFHGDNTGSNPVGDAKRDGSLKLPFKASKNEEFEVAPDWLPSKTSTPGKGLCPEAPFVGVFEPRVLIGPQQLSYVNHQ